MLKKILPASIILFFIIATVFSVIHRQSSKQSAVIGQSYTAQEPGFDAEPISSPETPYTLGKNNLYTLKELREWVRPDGPRRVGVQIGHLDNQRVPEELGGLDGNTGASFGQLTEYRVNQEIGNRVAALLETEGIVVDILPATVPPGYVADAFISIHADGNTSTAARGFKMAGPRRDYSGRSAQLVEDIDTVYAEQINMPRDNNITRRMTAYYAFNWPRYEHAVHPFTPSAIVETGFLTNALDRAIIVDQPEVVAKAIADGVLRFIERMPLPLLVPTTLVEPVQPFIGELVCAPIRAERRGRENETTCVPSISDNNGTHYILDGVATSAVAFGTQASVTGVYRPVQFVDNYFWFPYEVAGFFENPTIEYR